ncbi:MAG: hypothetical protein DRP64_01340 [Verrucomicrobia bacterium]|nr:MAG: hypothetical protein DRP64_01340 [Verrucomicrobiota bacterium]
MDFDVRTVAPKVSVCLLTYNHAPHIRECLDSILMQETNFPFEICIGEDGSTDGTREICVEYAEKHPERIQLIFRSRSDPEREAYAAQGNYNYVKTLKVCRGKYFADVDGDDAWLDPLKLQKQFDVIESNPSLCLVHSDCAVYDEYTDSIISRHIQRDRNIIHVVDSDSSRFMYDVLTSHYKIMTCSVFTRSSAVMAVIDEAPGLFREYANGDVPLWTELTRYGSFAYIDEPLSIYRVLAESATHSKDSLKRLGYYNRNEDLKLYLAKKYDLPSNEIRRNKIKVCNRLAMVSGDDVEIRKLYREDRASFPLRERMLYWLARVAVLRQVLCGIYGFISCRRTGRY